VGIDPCGGGFHATGISSRYDSDEEGPLMPQLLELEIEARPWELEPG
jgi:hypothetical protein